MVIAAVAGGLINGVVNGATTAYQTQQRANSYKSAAESVRTAADKYSGMNEYGRMQAAGQEWANEMNKLAHSNAINNIGLEQGATAMTGVNKHANDVSNSDVTNEAFQEGAQRQNLKDNALYNKETTQAQQAMKQADIDYNVANATTQAGMNALGNAVGVAGAGYSSKQ